MDVLAGFPCEKGFRRDSLARLGRGPAGCEAPLAVAAIAIGKPRFEDAPGRILDRDTMKIPGPRRAETQIGQLDAPAFGVLPNHRLLRPYRKPREIEKVAKRFLLLD